MKAIVVNAPGNIGYAEVEKPKPGPYEVLAKVSYCGICGTDSEIYYGDTSLTRKGLVRYPVRIGHEWSGVVEEVGAKVKEFKPGDRVISDTGSSCGICKECLSGNFKRCRQLRSLGTVGFHKEGAFAEYIVMYHWHMHKIPDNVSMEEAALVEPATIALNGLEDCAPDPESTVLITGTGAIGLLAVSMAKQKGLRVLLAGRKQFKLDVGLAMGADAVVNLTTEDLKTFVGEQTGGKGLELFYDTTGASEFITQALELTGYMGTIALVGFYEKSLNHFDVNRMVMEHKRIQGCEGSAWRAPQVLELAKQGKIRLKPLITGRIPFEEAADAIRSSRENTEKKIKILVEM